MAHRPRLVIRKHASFNNPADMTVPCATSSVDRHHRKHPLFSAPLRRSRGVLPLGGGDMSRSTLTGLNTSSSEREYVALGVELGMRGDGRGRLDYRSLSVQAGVLAQVCCVLYVRECL